MVAGSVILDFFIDYDSPTVLLFNIIILIIKYKFYKLKYFKNELI